MTDYAEEQSYEIEALESIYVDTFNVVETEPFHCFQIKVVSQDEDNDEETVSVTLQFTYTEKYPDEVPVMEIEDYESIDEEDVQELLKLMEEQAEENIGMVMVFTLVSAVQEELHNIVENTKKRLEEEADRCKKEKEAAELKKFQGTIVTIESFLAWKAKFDAEMEELRKLEGIQDKTSSKMTGRQLFMTDRSLDDSDVKFLEKEGDIVHVDESLFQDMDDLDLDDELDDLDDDE